MLIAVNTLQESNSKNGFKWYLYSHGKSQIRKNFSRTRNSWLHPESATANTLSHKVKFGVRKPFFIVFDMATSTKCLSASYIWVRFGVTEKTAHLLLDKVQEAKQQY
jgi:hypothetical protein